MHKIDSTPTTMKRRPWVTVRTVIFGLGAIVVGWFVVRYFVRLRALGYVDSAIGTMRTLASDENKFAETHPSMGYTCGLCGPKDRPGNCEGTKK